MYVQNNSLLLADILGTFKVCVFKYMYEFDSAHFLTAPVLAWQVYLKEAEVELELLKDIDMLLNVQNDIRGRICHATDQHSKGSNRYMKESDPNK